MNQNSTTRNVPTQSSEPQRGLANDGCAESEALQLRALREAYVAAFAQAFNLPTRIYMMNEATVRCINWFIFTFVDYIRVDHPEFWGGEIMRLDVDPKWGSSRAHEDNADTLRKIYKPAYQTFMRTRELLALRADSEWARNAPTRPSRFTALMNYIYNPATDDIERALRAAESLAAEQK
jgi:hypothetical protein